MKRFLANVLIGTGLVYGFSLMFVTDLNPQQASVFTFTAEPARDYGDVPAGPAEAPEGVGPSRSQNRPSPVELIPPVTVEAPQIELEPVVVEPQCWPTVKAYLDAWHFAGVQPEAPCFDAPEPSEPGAPGSVARDRSEDPAEWGE